MKNIMDIQARLYWKIIRQNMDKDDYFKHFDLEDFRFIVVNNIDNPVPLVWHFSQTHTDAPVVLGGITYRDPEEIGRELSYYLSESPKVPRNISLTKPNNIEEWFNNNGV